MSDNPMPRGAIPPVQRLPRGAIPSPRWALAASLPHVIIGPTPPQYINIPPKLSFWGNDKHGDCVTAEEAFAKACYNPEIFIQDADAIAWATRHNVLEGANINSVLTTMVSDGFHNLFTTMDDGPHSSVNWTDPATLNNAIFHGPVKIGIAANQLDHVYTYGKSGWFATGFQPDHAEDHCTSLCGYGSMAWLAQQLKVSVPAGVDGTHPGYAMFTWSTIGIIDQPSLLAITHEAWIRNPTTVIKRNLIPVIPRLKNQVPELETVG